LQTGFPDAPSFKEYNTEITGKGDIFEKQSKVCEFFTHHDIFRINAW